MIKCWKKQLWGEWKIFIVPAQTAHWLTVNQKQRFSTQRTTNKSNKIPKNCFYLIFYKSLEKLLLSSYWKFFLIKRFFVKSSKCKMTDKCHSIISCFKGPLWWIFAAILKSESLNGSYYKSELIWKKLIFLWKKVQKQSENSFNTKLLPHFTRIHYWIQLKCER